METLRSNRMLRSTGMIPRVRWRIAWSHGRSQRGRCAPLAIITIRMCRLCRSRILWEISHWGRIMWVELIVMILKELLRANKCLLPVAPISKSCCSCQKWRLVLSRNQKMSLNLPVWTRIRACFFQSNYSSAQTMPRNSWILRASRRTSVPEWRQRMTRRESRCSSSF